MYFCFLAETTRTTDAVVPVAILMSPETILMCEDKEELKEVAETHEILFVLKSPHPINESALCESSSKVACLEECLEAFDLAPVVRMS